MKRTILSVLFLMALTAVFAQQEIQTFVVGGGEKSYNQVKVVNETSYTDFGDYELKEKGDSDSNTKNGKNSRIPQGALLGIQFPKNFTGETSYYIEYLDYPLFDVIVIHLTDKGGGYSEEY